MALEVKESTCRCRRYKRHEFDSWIGKISWRRARQPIPVFLPGEPHGQGSLAGFSPWVTQLDTTEATRHAHTELDMHSEWCQPPTPASDQRTGPPAHCSSLPSPFSCSQTPSPASSVPHPGPPHHGGLSNPELPLLLGFPAPSGQSPSPQPGL